ncbi:GntR family transcriptional regulator [Mycolicibacterium setense]|uniref:FadR/GntR family transcriptional regulator n=1 Tax=Mycolicibacterium setense TaxID=431269 RepID=UPI0007EBD1E1|nr:FCD domain-containing protein [Mycolicibacterium setense]OBB13030.1 GntR family transcriptional regulator [Mycolicibacterium setense]
MTENPALRRAEWDRRPVDRGQTRPEQAAEQLAAIAASVEPGDRLGTKEELRTACGVSVGTFNEALRMVQSRGLVTLRSGPGGGLFASRQSPVVRLGNSMLALDDDAASVADAVRLRNALDPLLVEDALEHASAHDIRALRAELEHMKVAAEADDSTAFVRANWALHARIAAVSPSAILRSFYLNLLEIIESHLMAVQPVEGEPLVDYIHSRYMLHADLVDAIAARDPRALDLIHEHNTTGRSIPALSPGQTDTA